MSSDVEFVLVLLVVIAVFVGVFGIGAAMDKYYKFNRENDLFQCKSCGTYRRRYQLDMSTTTGYYEDNPKCVHNCIKKPIQKIGLYKDVQSAPQEYEYYRGTMAVVEEEYKWMRYVEEFPKLSAREYRICRKVEKNLTKRRRELKSYIAWADNWMKHNDGPPPVSEEQVIKSIGGKEYVDLLNSNNYINIESIRNDLNLPRLGK